MPAYPSLVGIFRDAEQLSTVAAVRRWLSRVQGLGIVLPR
jgi:hypothetical protein